MLSANKSLGQNFLTDKNLCDKIAGFANIATKKVIEIGGGQGSLTRSLMEITKNLIVVEKDERFREILEKLCSPVFIEDALKFDFRPYVDLNTVIVGNLPYNVGNPIIIYLLKTVRPHSMSFLLQKEVVDRICAKVNTQDYGKLSILIQSIAKVEKGFEIGPEAFIPRPKVTSAMIRIYDIIYDEKLINSLEIILSHFFANPRKKIGKVLDILGLSYDRDVRPGTISVEQYILFAKEYSKNYFNNLTNS